MRHLAWILFTAGVGALAAQTLTVRSIAAPPSWSLRTNVSGKEVPAVLGGGVAFGGAGAILAVLVCALFGLAPAAPAGLEHTTFVVFAALGMAGHWDDRRGDEAPRGFGGHLRAGRLTGGLVKIAAGAIAGIAAGALVYPDDFGMGALTALAVPLAANLFNLLDRAPGRTGKVALLVGIPLLALGNVHWAIDAAGPLGALAAVLPADLGERGMLGDMGANPIGAVIGLGLAVSLETAPLTAVVVLLFLLNAASERWSFSKAIERVALLRKLDAIGRK